MNVYFLIAVVVALSAGARYAELEHAWIRLLGILTCVGVVVGLAHTVARATIVQLQNCTDAAAALSRYQRLRRLHSVLSLAVYVAVLHGVGWEALVRFYWALDHWIVVDELLLLTPYLLAEALSFACFYAVELAVRDHLGKLGYGTPKWESLWQYLDFQLRSQIGVWLVATMMLVAIRDVFSWLIPEDADASTLAVLMVGLLSFSVLALSPVIIRIVWQAAPLPHGPVRERLESFAKRAGFRYLDILVWHTNGGVANAAITGLIPQLRYVLLSDALLQHLRPEEVESVFGHEVGHVKHHHFSYYLAFVIASVIFLTLLAIPTESAAQWLVGPEVWYWLQPAWQYLPPELWLLVPYLFVTFGYLSRRFERQADLYGCRGTDSRDELAALEYADAANDAVTFDADPGTSNAKAVDDGPTSPLVTADGIRTFIRSLEKVALINGIARRSWSWRHDSISRRVAFLAAVLDNPALANHFHRSVRRLRWALALVLLAGIALLFGLYWPVI
jgi:STE24 endopeptidase